MRKAVLALGLVVLLAGSVRGQEAKPWLEKIFLAVPGTSLSHDFGTVARGAQLTHRFKMKNIYAVPLEITKIRVSCGCVTWTQSTNVLQPNEDGYIDITMDARLFNGPKAVSIYVTVGPEYISTATLRVSAVARQDVVFNPGTVNFGIVQRGQTPTLTLDVEYSGVLDWRILEVIKNSAAPFQVKVEEIYRRMAFGNRPGRVGYRFTVTLKPDAAAGPFKQELILKTNDPASPNLTVPVEGTIQASLAVAPSSLQMGAVKVADKQTRRVIVRGSRPFRIVGVDGTGGGLTVDIPDRTAATHILTVTFQPTQAGPLRKRLTIRTDLDQEAVTVTVDGNATP